MVLRNAERFESVSRGTFKLVDVPNLNHDARDESEDHDSWLTNEEANEKVEEVEEDDGPFDGTVNLVWTVPAPGIRSCPRDVVDVATGLTPTDQVVQPLPETRRWTTS